MTTFKDFLTEARGDPRYDSQGRQMGTRDNWFYIIGATNEDAVKAAKLVRQSDIYKKWLKLGFKDTTPDSKHGTITMRVDYFNERKDLLSVRFDFLSRGRVTAYVQDEARQHYALAVPKVKVIKGDPVQTIYNTMTAALEHVYKKASTRFKDGKLIGRLTTKGNSGELKHDEVRDIPLEKLSSSEVIELQKQMKSYVSRAARKMPRENGFNFEVRLDPGEMTVVLFRHGAKALDVNELHADPDELDKKDFEEPPMPDYVAQVKAIIQKGLDSDKIDSRLIRRPLNVKLEKIEHQMAPFAFQNRYIRVKLADATNLPKDKK